MTRLPLVFAPAVRAALVIAAAGVAAALAGACAGPRASAAPSSTRTAGATAAPAAATPAPPAAVETGCGSATPPPVPTPMSPVSAPGAPRTTVYIVGTVCSAITGRALPGARIGVDLLEQSCADGHQPWRCGGRAVADGLGHYGIALYDPGDYGFVVRVAGYRPAAGTVHAAQPGVVTRDWRLGQAA